MLPPDWDALQPLIDEVLEAPEEMRAGLIAKLSAGNPKRRAELEKMVAECSGEGAFLARPAGERFANLFSDEVEPPPPEILGGYRIEREIGRGGMARVYLADDAKHSRRVAVKVIRSELAASLGRERFLREISTAARLRHPNIVPLYDSGDADGLLYFVMPYEEGPSLRERLRSGGKLTVEERVSTLRDIARALAYAHQHGVVHRDIKPDNVMLSGGAAVVTDFGISKAVTSAQGESVPGTLTQSGSGIGTPAYMAPEQAVGDPATDHRADIYSFGCLAYEMFAGEPPFKGESSHQVITAHVGTAPSPIESRAADVPGPIANLIAACLQKNPDARPQSAQAVLAALESSSDIARSSQRRSSRILRVAIPLVVLVLVGAAVAMSRRNVSPCESTPANCTVAVLPLVSVGRDSIQQELADGLSDEIAIALFKVPGLRIVSRKGVGNYRGQRELDAAKIGRDLGAHFLVSGSLRQVGGRLVVLTQLVNAPDGVTLWSDRYDRVQSDLGPLRDQIVQSVGDTLHRILRIDAKPVRAARSVNPEAYRLYVLAQRALDRRGLSVKTSVELFKRATEIDTTFANGYSGLSMAIALSPHFGPVSGRDVTAEAVANAKRALTLDPSLAQPHIALGLVYQFSYQWDRARQEFEKAVSLDSRDVEARVQYGRHLLFRNRIADALPQFLAARAEDPASALVLSWVSYTYYLRGQMDSALVESARAYQSDSTNASTLGLGSLVQLKAGHGAKARYYAERALRASEVHFYVLAALGDTAAAFSRLRKFAATTPLGWRAETNRAYAMLGAGDTAQAITAFERATDANEIWPALQSTSDPIFNPIRASPRFQKLLRRVGIE